MLTGGSFSNQTTKQYVTPEQFYWFSA